LPRVTDEASRPSVVDEERLRCYPRVVVDMNTVCSELMSR